MSVSQESSERLIKWNMRANRTGSKKTWIWNRGINLWINCLKENICCGFHPVRPVELVFFFIFFYLFVSNSHTGTAVTYCYWLNYSNFQDRQEKNHKSNIMNNNCTIYIFFFNQFLVISCHKKKTIGVARKAFWNLFWVLEVLLRAIFAEFHELVKRGSEKF